MNTDYRTVCLFPSATCNLACAYCNIEKNSHLKDIDKMLEDSFNDEDYYFNFIKDYFSKSFQLLRLETWGGEPFLHIERIYPTLRKLINHYPYFKEFFSSTNFSFKNWDEKVWKTIEVFGEFPNRVFDFYLQLSIDGTEEMNDANRGNGTTRKCLDNYITFISQIKDRLPDNVNLKIYTKSTLSVENVHYLNNKERIIEYYKFFEDELMTPMVDAKGNKKNVELYPGVPNMACPAPVTKMDGIVFSQYIQKCKEIEKEAEKHFRFTRKIVPYRKFHDYNKDTFRNTAIGCGDCHVRIGFLPNRNLTSCNEGFLYLNDNYLKMDKAPTEVIIKSVNPVLQKMCLTEEEHKKYQTQKRYFLATNSTAVSADTTSYISLLAACNQIDKKYLNLKEAVNAANFIVTNGAFCFKDNYGVTGCRQMIPDSLIKLMLNGALDQILEDEDD